MARDDVFASSDVLDELMPWALGAWLPESPAYASLCDPKAVAVPLGQLLRILLDERPWAQDLSDMDAADAVRSWLRGALRNLATRRRVSKAWAAAGQRCFDALVAELRRRAAAHARAARAFLDASPKVYPGELPPGSWIDSKRETLVRRWSKDAEGAKHVPLLQALFEHCFHDCAVPLSPLEVRSVLSGSVYAKHSVWPRRWVVQLAALAAPISERQLWDTLHRRCRCCPRSSPCCLQADREQVLHRGGGDGCGSDSRRLVQLGPWPEVEVRAPLVRVHARVGRSALPSYVADATASVETVSTPIAASADGMPCVKCNECDLVKLPYTHKRDVVTVVIRKRHALGYVHCRVVGLSPRGFSSNEGLLHMMIKGASRSPHCKWNVAARSLHRRRELALLGTIGPRVSCTCSLNLHDTRWSELRISLPLFHVEDGVDASWASVLGLDRAELHREAVEWPHLESAPPLIVDAWRRLELERRISLLCESMPGKYASDWSIMFRHVDTRLFSPAPLIDGNMAVFGGRQLEVEQAHWNLEHLRLYAPLRPLLESVSADQTKAKTLGVAAATRYLERFGGDEAMVEYFRRIECLLGPALRHVNARAVQPPNEVEPPPLLRERRLLLYRIACAYIDATPHQPPMSGSERLQAVADVPTNSLTHPDLLLRWYLAAICHQDKPFAMSSVLDFVEAVWTPPQPAEGSPPETIPEAEMVAHLSFWATHELNSRGNSTWPSHMRFGFAVRMRDFDRLCCTTLGLAARELSGQQLSKRDWALQATRMAEAVTRHVRVSDVRRLELLETVLNLPWAPVFPLAPTLREPSTDAPEGTLGMRALEGLCHKRGGWLGRLHPKT